MNFYGRVFEGPAPQIPARYGEGEGPDQAGTERLARFTLWGQEFVAVDSAREHNVTFNEAVSLAAPCETQEEIDAIRTALSADPKAEQCGWLKDQFGVSRQGTAAALRRTYEGR